jgi:hypothetical protein
VDDAYGTHGKIRNAYNILVQRLEWKRALGRPRHRRGNIRMDVKRNMA